MSGDATHAVCALITALCTSSVNDFNAFGECLHCFRKPSVLLDHLDKEGRLLCRKRRPFLARSVQGLPVFRVRLGMGNVAVSLSGLGQQDEWSRICRLEAESEV